MGSGGVVCACRKPRPQPRLSPGRLLNASLNAATLKRRSLLRPSAGSSELEEPEELEPAEADAAGGRRRT